MLVVCFCLQRLILLLTVAEMCAAFFCNWLIAAHLSAECLNVGSITYMDYCFAIKELWFVGLE
jgi:hypothetical protein